MGQQNPKVYTNKAHASAIKCARQRLPFKKQELESVRDEGENKGVMLLSQLFCTFSCILLTSLISISFQHIQPLLAMNQNLEGSLFSALRKKTL